MRYVVGYYKSTRQSRNIAHYLTDQGEVSGRRRAANEYVTKTEADEAVEQVKRVARTWAKDDMDSSVTRTPFVEVMK